MVDKVENNRPADSESDAVSENLSLLTNTPDSQLVNLLRGAKDTSIINDLFGRLEIVVSQGDSGGKDDQPATWGSVKLANRQSPTADSQASDTKLPADNQTPPKGIEKQKESDIDMRA